MTLKQALATGTLLAVAGLGAPLLAATQEVTLDLVEPITDYKLYVSDRTAQLVEDTGALVAAIHAGDLEKAKALYAPTRTSYEEIEPIAELFADLDASIDARADDYETAEKDPAFTGFHRIEYGLWVEKDTAAIAGYADRLMADVKDLDQRIAALTFPPETVVGGAAALMEEVAASKVSGEEDRYSRTDLWDFQANTDGAKKVFELVRPLIEPTDPAFVSTVQSNFDDVDQTLAHYRTANGFEDYEELSDQDRTLLSARVNTLAEDLSTLRGKLGLD
ncbi:iron uptake system protein EfeO (plasmid) [Paroceanicella profunda]|uniref:Iron uptake system protein EfeO n=2 Tax=Paroceanicella profunda TaxID=2579971 RepID=A0A5B8G342_9RHOB|nr:iron uptake system protein EfeO [Paroceanicella profunda]QDL94524.1 iron uptake system protein EfeO [Paroceanicella profunda]